MTKQDFIKKWIGWVSYSNRINLTKEMESDLEAVSQVSDISDVNVCKIMKDLIERLEQVEQLELPNGAKGAVWLDDVIEIIEKHLYSDMKQM